MLDNLVTLEKKTGIENLQKLFSLMFHFNSRTNKVECSDLLNRFSFPYHTTREPCNLFEVEGFRTWLGTYLTTIPT